MTPANRLRDGAGRYCLDITDRVVDRQTGDRVRVTGFYRMRRRDAVGAKPHLSLIACNPDDTRMSVIATYALCGQFHRPWDLDFNGFIPWSEDAIASEKDTARRYVEDADSSINSNGYPRLFEKLCPDLSAHGEMKLEIWRNEISRSIESALFPVLPGMMAWEE